MRLVSFLLSIALTIGASRAIKLLDTPPLNSSHKLSPARQIAFCLASLRGDLANPYRWSELAAAFQAGDDLARARDCQRRASDLSGAVPQVLLNAATFSFDHGDVDQALPLAARVLKLTPDFDSTIFTYFDHFLSSPAPVFIAMGLNQRPILAYTQHLIDLGDMHAARLGWRFALSAHIADNRLASSYLDGMILRAHHYADAQRDWADYLGSARGDYPATNLLFNAGFEREPTGSPMDWRIQPSDMFETKRDTSVAHAGKCSLQIRFQGTDNVSYSHVSQLTAVTPGLYYLQAWVRSESLTTNEGPRLEIVDAEVPARLDIRTASITGTRPWELVVQPLVIPPQTSLVTVRVVRDMSRQADDRIAGTFWLDEVRLRRE